MTEESLFYPKQHQSECELNSELLLLAVANVLFIFLCPVLGKKKKHVYFLLWWPRTCMIEMLIYKCAMTSPDSSYHLLPHTLHQNSLRYHLSSQQTAAFETAPAFPIQRDIFSH